MRSIGVSDFGKRGTPGIQKRAVCCVISVIFQPKQQHEFGATAKKLWNSD